MRVPLAVANAPTGVLRRSISQAPSRVTPASSEHQSEQEVDRGVDDVHAFDGTGK